MDVKLVIRELSERPTISQSWVFESNVAILYSLTRGSFEVSGAWLNSMFRQSARPSGMTIINFL